MEVKKAPQADISRKRGMFFNVGLIVALTLAITAFEWKFLDDLEVISLGELNVEPEALINLPIITPPQPPAQAIKNPIIVETKEDKQELQKVIFEEYKPDDAPDNSFVKPELPKPEIINNDEPDPEQEFIIVESQPEPNGGMKKFYEYISKEINYPKQARRMGVEGRVFVQFVVDKNGKLTDLKVLKGIGSGCDEEAIRVLQNAPLWNPGKQRGRAVKVRMSLPIMFKLNH